MISDNPKKILWINEKTDGGGAGKLYFSGKRILEDDGATVAPFFGCFNDGEVEREFVRFQPPSISDQDLLGFTGRLMYHQKVLRRLDYFIKYFNPDFIIVQNCQKFLPPYVISHISKLMIPMTLLINDYAPYCAKYYAWRNGAVCHSCIDRKFSRSIIKGCSNRSGLTGWLQTVSRSFSLNQIWRDNGYFGSGSYMTAGKNFERNLVNMGFDAKRIVTGIFPHFVPGVRNEKYFVDYKSFVFYGSQLQVKGQQLILDACRYLPRNVLVKMFVLKPCSSLESSILESNNRGGAQIELINNLSWHTGLKDHICRAAAVIIPSLWESPHELVLYESMALGKPVLVTDVSSNSEIVEYGVTGYVFSSGSAEGLARAMMLIYNSPDLTLKMGAAAAEYYEKYLHPRNWLGQFMEATRISRSWLQKSYI